VIVDPTCDLEENRRKTAEEREERMVELEEQGFLTVNSLGEFRFIQYGAVWVGSSVEYIIVYFCSTASGVPCHV
jgi:hypothetical protein